MSEEIDVPIKKNPHAVILGKRGGKKGGLARAASLSPERRSAIAKHAVSKRKWHPVKTYDMEAK